MIGTTHTSTAAAPTAAATSSATRIDARPRLCRRGIDAARTDGGQA